jgi:DNA-binding transcriptional LysR family regulator
LLNRTTRQLVLTEAGQRFHEDALRILDSLEQARRHATACQEGVRGLIRVHCTSSAGSAILIPALPQFLAKHPDVTVDLTLTDDRVDIVREKVDVAIWRSRMEDSGLVARLLGSARRLLCASPGYLARRGTPAVPADLGRHNCLVYSGRGYPSEWIFEKDGQTIRVPVAGNLRTDAASALFSSTLQGLGLAVFAEWIVRDACRQRQLQVVLPDYEVRLADTTTELYLVYPHRSPPPKVAAFIHFVLALFGREGSGAPNISRARIAAVTALGQPE